MMIGYEAYQKTPSKRNRTAECMEEYSPAATQVSQAGFYVECFYRRLIYQPLFIRNSEAFSIFNTI